MNRLTVDGHFDMKTLVLKQWRNMAWMVRQLAFIILDCVYVMEYHTVRGEGVWQATTGDIVIFIQKISVIL